jgi:hypothetical protein
MDFGQYSFLIQSAIGGVISGVAFWATVRVELKWLRRDVDQLIERSNNSR